ncbi:MAG: CHAT domain-containing protein, partial [Blastocatellia bacterium]|nr:CHAT domain-containing protein [Blastocatellia bacterium]
QELGRKTEVARLWTNMGLVQAALGQPKLSLEYFQRGLKLHEELGDDVNAAGVLDNIGELYYEQENYQLASEYYRKSLAIYLSAGVTDVVANQYLRLAELEYEQGNDEAALKYYQQSLAKYDEVKNKRSRAYVLHTIANLHYNQGDYSQALVYYQASLQTAEESGNKQGAASALLGIGLVHSLTGNYGQALEDYQKNLAVTQTFGSKEALANALEKVGGAYYTLLDYEKALEFYGQELALRQEIGNQDGIAGSLLDLGIVLTARGDYEKALDHYQRSREKFEAGGNRKGVATALLNSCGVYYLLADFAKTLEVAGQAAGLALQTGEMDLYWQARYRAGKAHYRLEELDAAEADFADAITTIETKLPLVTNTQQPRYFPESKFAPYLGMVDVLIAKGRGNEAFNYAERARSRALLVLLRNEKAWITKTMTPAEEGRERNILGEITTLSNRIYREMERSPSDQQRLAALRSRRAKAQLAYDSYKKRLYARHPLLKSMRGEGPPLNILQAARLAVDPKRALLDFFETDERAYLFAFTKNREQGNRRSRKTASTMPALKIYVLNTNRADLDARIAAYRQLLENRSAEIAEIEAKSRELYDQLLKPAEEQLAGRSQLVIVPDGSLWNLPFQSLLMGQTGEGEDGGGHYLISDYAISYTQSLTAYRSMFSLRGSRRGGDKRDLLAFGNPSTSEESAKRIKAMLQTDKLDQPSETEGEVEELGKLYGKDSQVFAGAEARADRFIAECGKYRILHLATRGIISDVSPFFSPVVFSPAKNGENDGVLEVRELLNLDLKAELAVVSASEVPPVRGGGGRGMTGLSWAFFIAGCPSTMVSRWRPQSPAASDLMLEFHRNLRAARSQARSWQLAVKQLLTKEEYRHPYYWAGFELLGNGQ